jgi:hypothetical protein
MNPWLGAERGFLSDWTTQSWVRATGRPVTLTEAPWLRGPRAAPRGIADDEFERYAAAEGLAVEADDGDVGLLDDFGALRSDRFDPADVRPEIVDFYERTSRYRLHLWSQWSPAFAPFGRAVDRIFARRLGQLQLPLAPLDTSGGILSRVVRLRGDDGRTETAWLRHRRPDGEVLYTGLYSIARPPLAAGPCVKVAFPLPNGNGSVFLEPVARPDGSLDLLSAADAFGDAGFYFVVARDGAAARARHVRQLTERIHVYVDSHGELHTDHHFRLWGRVFLRLHYAMPARGPAAGPTP